MGKLGILVELFQFVVHRKKFVLGPLIFVCLVLGSLLILGGNPTFAPFLYALF